jgi:CHAT domain-containing protein
MTNLILPGGFWMHPALKLVGLAVASLVFSLPIALLMEGSRERVTLAAPPKQQAQEVGGDERKGKADYLMDRGFRLLNSRQAQAALESWQQALKLYKEIRDKKGEIEALGCVGLAYRELGNYEKALYYLQNQLNFIQQSPDRRDEGVALGNLGLVYHSLKKYPQAIKLQQESLRIAGKNKDVFGEYAALGNLARSLRDNKKYEQAIQTALAALDVRPNLPFFPDDSYKNPYELFETLGLSYAKISNFKEAISMYEKAVSIVRSIDLQEDEIRLLSGLAGSYYYDDKPEQAIEAYNRQLLLLSRKSNPAIEVETLVGIGDSYAKLGQYSQAINFHQKALDIARSNQNSAGIRRSLISLAMVNGSVGNYKAAKDSYHSVLKELEKQGALDDDDSRNLNLVLAGLGTAYQGVEEYQKSITFYNRRIEIARKQGDLRGEMIALSNSALVNFRLGKLKEGSDSLIKGLEIAEQLKDRSAQAKLSGHIGLVATASNADGASEIAIQYHKQSLLIASEIKDYETQAIALQNLGYLFLRGNENKLAETNLKDSIEIWESFRTGLVDEQRRSLAEKSVQSYRFLQQVQIALQKPESALETSDRGRARAFIELLAARFAGETLENAIAKQKVEKLSIAQIQQVAKTQAATLVQYSIVSDKELYIYIVQPDGRISFRKADISVLGKSLNDFVNASRDGLGVRGRTDRAAFLVPILPEKQRELQAQRDSSLRQLHKLLIEPIADLLPNNETDRVIFMPQGQLFLVPFPALLNAQNQPLIAQHTILTAPSIQTLDLTHKTAQNRPQGTRPALVVGNPTMPAVSTVIGDPPQRLTQLPGAETEAKAIAQKLNTQAITGTNARKDVVMQKMQNASIIHLATHGLLDSFKGDTPGAIALAPNGNGERNDGLLTSGEIFDLKLNADLVVLSACDTGRGDITGDGVIGLSRSLFVAGVPSVIVSLWKVPDDSTALLMSEFYKNWKDRKLNKAQALRQAMLTTQAKYPDPLDWAAFTLIGEAE